MDLDKAARCVEIVAREIGATKIDVSDTVKCVPTSTIKISVIIENGRAE